MNMWLGGPRPPWRVPKVDRSTSRQEQEIKTKALVEQNDDGLSEPPEKHGIADRVHGLIHHDDPPAIPPRKEPPASDPWAIELQRRRDRGQQVDDH